MKTKKRTIAPVSLWMTYSDGSLRVRYFNKSKPLDAWWRTALKLKAMGVVDLCTIFPVSGLPANCVFTLV
jgi:hypothetical protein